MSIHTRAIATTLVIVLAACGTEEQPESAPSTAATAQELPRSLVLRLAEEYPVLGEEPRPQPQPSEDATPQRVPERVREALPRRALEVVTGEATFYADHFEGRRTASGIPFRQNQMVAAHRAFPFGTLLRVTNLRNDRSVTVRVVDRGPFGGSAKARSTILDLSRRAAGELGYIGAGRTPVRVEVLEWGEGIARAG